MIAVVTDSNTMVPSSLRDRYGIRVVPLTFVVDGEPRSETDDVDLPAFFAALRGGAEVTTAAPSPGEVATVYQAAVEDGAAEIVSVHVGEGYSGTLNAVRVAAGLVDVPVHVVDTGNASFAAGCAVWRAAESVAEGGTAPDVRAAAESVAAGIASVFTVAEVDRARAGGRLEVADGDGVPILALHGADLAEIGRAHTVEQAVAAMRAHVALVAGPLRVGVGDADAPEASAALIDALRPLANVAEVVRYTVGPTVAAHTGAGTFGAVYHPLA